MFRRHSSIRPAAWLALLLTAFMSRGARGDDVAAYLAGHDLDHVLAVYLEQQLEGATGEERDELLRTLADLYAQLLESTVREDLRESLERRGAEILAQAPAEGADALRLALLRGPYRLAERIAEQHRLRLADADELARARAALDETVAELLMMVQRMDQSARSADRKLARAGGYRAEELSIEAERAAALASQTRFLAAWALYYTAYLNDRPAAARQAQELFSALLDPDVAALRPEGVSIDLRGVDAFARSILGMALCRSLTSTSADAMQWLVLLEHELTVEAIREQVPVWSMAIHLEHEEYRQARQVLIDTVGDSATAPPLWLRLLAVHSAEDESYDVAAVENVRLAVTGLAAQGELEQVLDLARRYGDDLLGNSGFAMQYVNGLLTYQKARALHGSENPPADDDAAALYASAAERFELAIQEVDARDYASAAAGSLRLIGLCRYFRGEFLAARDAFVKAAGELPSEQAADALWMAIASLDQVVRVSDSAALRSDLHALIERFLNEFPSNHRAPKLVVRRAATMREPDPAVVRELLAVPRDSPSYGEARQRAAELLYAMFRQAEDEQRAQWGGEFLDVVVPLIVEAQPVHAAPPNEQAAVLVQARRALEVSLTRGIGRIGAAEQALRAIDALREADATLLAEHESEMQFRRLQLHLLRSDLAQAVVVADTLWQNDEQAVWSRLAARALFQYLHDQLETEQLNRDPSVDTLNLLVKYGGRVLREYENDDDALRDRKVLSFHAVVADAAMRIWQQTGDAGMGRKALFLYSDKLLDARPSNAGFLRSTAILAEHFEKQDRALECWRRLVAGLPQDRESWFEAKFHVLSILANTDPQRARAVMDQHTALHPGYGPDPWGARLKALDARLPAAQPSESRP